MKTFILLTTTLFLTSVFGQASECDFDMSGTYDCGSRAGEITISQNWENIEIQLPNLFMGTDKVIADGAKRTANFKYYARPVAYTASCYSLASKMTYEMSSADGAMIRKVELIAIKDYLGLVINTESGTGFNIATTCSRL